MGFMTIHRTQGAFIPILVSKLLLMGNLDYSIPKFWILLNACKKIPRLLNLCTTKQLMLKTILSRRVVIRCVYQDLDVPILFSIDEE